jgi:PTH1 family peptidyl-tRNA hydrolase
MIQLFKKASSSGVGWILVFLGNPGPQYAKSRHNTGFLVCDALSASRGLKPDRLRFHALTCLASLCGTKVLLMKPQTYMNLSGDAVREAQAFYHVPTERILVVSDDVSLPAGKLRVRRSGSAGGHNGLKDIIAKCGGDGFPRVKVGVGAPPPEYDLADWVLGSCHGDDETAWKDAIARAALAVEEILTDGVDAAMQKYN